MRDHRRLEVWSLAHDLTLQLYAVTASFPSDERFGLAMQLRRSATSIGSNIVEGAARASRAEFARFLDIAVGSASECHYQLLLARDLGYIEASTHSELADCADKVRRKLSKLRAAVVRSAP